MRVLIAEDHHLVRQGIRALLEKHSSIEVVGEAKDGREALAFTSQLLPDILLLDINLPHITGIEVARDIQELGLKTVVVMLSMYSDESLIRRAFQNGARGYLLKSSIAADLIEAVECAYRGEFYLSPDIRENFNLDELRQLHALSWSTAKTPHITPRERQVCQLIAQGLTNQAIARKLNISVKTVEKHRAHLMEKLGVQDMAGLMRAAFQQGLIFLDD